MAKEIRALQIYDVTISQIYKIKNNVTILVK